jgi:hypothetical protein
MLNYNKWSKKELSKSGKQADNVAYGIDHHKSIQYATENISHIILVKCIIAIWLIYSHVYQTVSLDFMVLHMIFFY